MKRLLCIFATSWLAVSTSAFAWSFFPNNLPLTAIAVSATATPAVTPMPAPTLDLKAFVAPTPKPASSPLAEKASPKTEAKSPLVANPKEHGKSASKIAPMPPGNLAAIDFAPKKFDIMAPPPSDWTESLLDASGVSGLYSYLFDHQGRRKKSRHMIKVGTVYLPTTMLSTSAVSTEGDFTVRRLSLQYALVPRTNGISQVKRYIKGFRVEFLITANKQNCIQIKDILPSTLFMNANFGGKLGVSTSVCMSRAGEFMMAGDAVQQDVGGAFAWNYQPKNLVVASGAVGNSAFVEFEPKGDGTFYVGQVPIEISLIVPRGVRTADLKIVNTLITSKNKLLPLGEISSKVILP